jgi:hypothetical protein
MLIGNYTASCPINWEGKAWDACGDRERGDFYGLAKMGITD